jgi:hypothetical protein
MAARGSLLLPLLLLQSQRVGGAALGVASAGISWDAMYRELDRLPVFVLANAQRAPLQFERDGMPLAVFYESPVQAEAALIQAIQAYPSLGLRLVPTGLGNALKLARDGGRGVLVPEPSNLRQAKALAPILEGAAAWGEAGSLPLFGCPRMRKPLEDGRSGIPLFLSHADATLALEAAGRAQGAEGLELECCPLVSMAEQLVSGGVAGPVQFVPSREAARYTAELIARPSRLPKGLPTGAARRAMTHIYSETAGSSGLFPT